MRLVPPQVDGPMLGYRVLAVPTMTPTRSKADL